MQTDLDGFMRVIHIWLGDWVIQFWWGGWKWHPIPYVYYDPDDRYGLFWHWQIPGLEIRAWSDAKWWRKRHGRT